MPKILLIEDNEHYAAVTKHLLESHQFEVVHALNGKLGVKEAKKMPPDIILLDLVMPVMDGFETLKHLKQEEDLVDIPVMILTSKDDDQSLREAMEAHASNFLNKSDEPEEIVAKIKKALEIRGLF